MPIKNVIIADPQPLVFNALNSIVKQALPYSTVIPAQTAAEIIKVIKHQTVALLILEVTLADSDSFDLVRRIKSAGFKGKILFVSGSAYPLHSEMARQMDVDGYIEKSESTDVIREGIISIMHGYTVFKRSQGREQPLPLSKRETVVLNYLVNGYSNKEIANQLCLSAKTVSTYKARILEKHKVKSIIALMNIYGQLNESISSAA